MPKLTEKIQPLQGLDDDPSILSTTLFNEEVETSKQNTETDAHIHDDKNDLESSGEELSPLSCCEPGYENSEIDHAVKEPEEERKVDPGKASSFLPKAKMTFP
mmetsp:Transcript_21464/g.33146  ORF Transcript_21464/g.33146 Transcript_21464/m.33146 type:complete len:103 (+) Transcript_21464:282-590(+)